MKVDAACIVKTASLLVDSLSVVFSSEHVSSTHAQWMTTVTLLPLYCTECGFCCRVSLPVRLQPRRRHQPRSRPQQSLLRSDCLSLYHSCFVFIGNMCYHEACEVQISLHGPICMAHDLQFGLHMCRYCGLHYVYRPSRRCVMRHKRVIDNVDSGMALNQAPDGTHGLHGMRIWFEMRFKLNAVRTAIVAVVVRVE